MLLALAGVSSAAMAQQKPVVVEQVDIIQVQDKYQVITNPFWSNWFFSIGGGASVMYGDNDQQLGDFGKRISPTMNISVGKWFTPGLGLRLQYSGLQAKGFTMDPFADYVKGTQRENGSYKQRFEYMNFHGDVMFNLNALFGGYNQYRVYEIIPYLGAGITHNYTKPHRQALSVNAGKGYDGVFSATLGLTYHFPKRGFNRPMPQLISALELSAMQQQIAEMAAANQQLESALTAAQNRPVEVAETEVVVTDPNIAPRTVFFNIGSAEVSPREVMNISYLAKQMQEFPNATYTVNGYADSATGTPEFNKELSLKRAQAVVDVLVKDYGISADRLKISADGGVDKFGQPILNRVVLVKSAN